MSNNPELNSVDTTLNKLATQSTSLQATYESNSVDTTLNKLATQSTSLQATYALSPSLNQITKGDSLSHNNIVFGTKRHGIERIDGLLLNGRGNQLYEINLETPQTIQQIYKKYPTFVENTSVPRDIEDMVKDSFIEGDWDDDDERGDCDPSSDSENSSLIDVSVSQTDQNQNLPPSYVHKQFSSKYSKRLANKPITAYTCIRAIEYLHKMGTTNEIKDYIKFRKYLNEKKETLRQLFVHNYAFYNNFDENDLDNMSLKKLHAFEKIIALPPPKREMIEHHPEISTSTRILTSSPSTATDNDDSMAPIISRTTLNTNMTMYSTSPTALPSYPLSPEPEPSDLAHATPDHIHELLPEPKHVPKLSKSVEHALTYRTNNHTMFCLSIRNITNTAINNHSDGTYQDINYINNNTNTNNITSVDSNNNHIVYNNLLVKNVENEKNTQLTQRDASNYHISPLYSDLHHDLLDDIYGIVFCRIISSSHMMDWINKDQEKPLADYITGCQIQHAQLEAQTTTQLQHQHQIDPFNTTLNQNLLRTNFHTNCTSDKQHSNSTPHIELPPSPTLTSSPLLLEQPSQTSSLPCQTNTSTIESFEHIETATPDEIYSFLKAATLHKQPISTTKSSFPSSGQEDQNIPSHLIIEEIDNGTSGSDTADTADTAQKNITSDKKGENQDQNQDQDQDDDISFDQIALYCPIAEIPDSEDDEDNNTVGDNDRIEQQLKAQQSSTVSLMTNKTSLQEEQTIIEIESIQDQLEQLEQQQQQQQQQQQVSSSNQDSITKYHWVKIELISLLSEHRAKGCGNLLFLGALLAGSLSQRFHQTINDMAAMTTNGDGHFAHKSNSNRGNSPNGQINNAILSLAGGTQNNPKAGKLYEQHGFIPIPLNENKTTSYFKHPNRDLYVLLSINKIFKKIRWDDLIAGLHSLE